MKDKIIIAHKAIDNSLIAFPTSSIIVISDDNDDSKKSTVYLITGKGYQVNENCNKLSKQIDNNDEYIKVHGTKSNKERIILMDKISHIEDSTKGSLLLFKYDVIESININENINQIINQLKMKIN